MNDSPAVILYDGYGNPVVVIDGYAIHVQSKGIPGMVARENNTFTFIRADNDGYAFNSSRIVESLPAGTNILGQIGIDPLNTGGLALESTLSDSYQTLISLDNKDFATETTLSSLNSKDFATQTTLYDSYQTLISLDNKDFATETTLSSLNSKDFATESTLYDSYEILRRIKDVDGVKRIEDALPVGDNIIGRVKITDGTDLFEISTTGEGHVSLYDDYTGTAMAFQDGDEISLNKGGLLIGGRHVEDGGVGNDGYFLNVKDDADVSSQKRLLVEADIKPGATINVTTQAATGASVSEFLTNVTYDEDMVQNGSVTPISYRYSAPTTHNLILSSLRIVMSANSFKFDGDSFGKGGAKLTNGILISIVANDGDINRSLISIQINEDYWRLLDFDVSQAGATDVIAASARFGSGIKLIANSSDYVETVIQDNLTLGSQDIYYLTGTLYGSIEEI